MRSAAIIFDRLATGSTPSGRWRPHTRPASMSESRAPTNTSATTRIGPRTSVHGVLGPAVGGAAPLGEELDREQAEDEPAHVGEVRHAASVAGRVGEVDGGEERLLREPDEDEQEGR